MSQYICIFILICKLSCFQHPTRKISKEVLLGIGKQDISGPVTARGLTPMFVLAETALHFTTAFLYLQMESCASVTTEGPSQRQKSKPSSTAWSSFLVSNVHPGGAELSDIPNTNLCLGPGGGEPTGERNLSIGTFTSVWLEWSAWNVSVYLWLLQRMTFVF